VVVNLKIDLNCDLGEGLDNEHLLMPYLSSCNIACGAHAGSVEIIDKTIALALKHGVKIGAHPSFPDRDNFGRLVMEISNTQLQESLEEQLLLFKERADRQDAKVHHVKAHGALYNLVAIDEEKAALLIEAVRRVFDNTKIYVPFNSSIEKVAETHRMEVVYEAFADRNYNDDLTLLPRALPQAMMFDPEEILAHIRRMVYESKVKTLQGIELEIKAETFCIHGDNPNAQEILERLHEEFKLD